MFRILKNKEFTFSESMLCDLISGHPLPTWIVSAKKFQIVFANNAVANQYGYTPGLPLNFDELFPEGQRIKVISDLSEKKLSGTYDLLKNDGKKIEVIIHSSPVTIEGDLYYQISAFEKPDDLKGKIQNDAHENSSEKENPVLKNEEELELLVQLVEQTSDVLTAADIEFRPLTWNSAAESVYGLAKEQVIGKDLSTLIKFHYHNATREEIREIIKNRNEWRGEASFIRPSDKKLVTVLIGFKRMLTGNGDPKGYLISATDISERKEAESRLRESENRFREMADSSPAMIWMTDEQHIPVYINKEWLHFTGKDIIGSRDGWASLVHPDDLEKVLTESKSAYINHQHVTLYYRLLRSDGIFRWVYDVSVPRFLSNGNFIGYIGSVVDIEEEKQKQEELLYQSMILENVSDIIVATDLDFRIKVLNKAAEKNYGIVEEEVIGKKLSDFVEFHYVGSTREKSYSALRENGVWHGEVFILNAQGEKEYFHHTVKYVMDENDSQIGILSTARNITDRKLAGEKLKRSEQFYRALITNSLDGMLLMNADGKITFASPSVKHVLGYEVDEILNRNGFEFVHPDDIKWAFESFQKEVVEQPEVKFIVVRLLNKSGEWLWCMVRGHNLLGNKYVNSLVVYFHDDTLRKKATDALKESERQFRNLIRDIQLGVVLQDKHGRNILCNDAFAQMFASTKEEILGIEIQDIAIDPIHEDGRRFSQEERPTYKAIFTKQPARDVVMGIIRPNVNHRVWLLINADPVLDEKGELLHIICCVKDITDRKKMEEDQMIKQMQHQRQLTQASIDGQEKERKEIGKELHDNIGQQLTTIKLFLDIAKTTADDTTNEMVSMGLKGISDVINDIREMSRSLVPSTLKDLGLVESIAELVDSFTRTQAIHISFVHEGFHEDLLQENQRLALFRIIQEQLNNIVKHARADHANIRLGRRDRLVTLEISDDGTGFDVDKIKKGLGFINIRNRAELLDGLSEIISSPGKGCILKVVLPVTPIS